MSTELPEVKNEGTRKKFSFYSLSSTIAGALTYLLIFLHNLIDMSFLWAAILAPLAAIVAIITGHKGKHEIHEAEGNMAGKKLANAGLIMGYVYIGTCILIAVLVIVGIVLGAKLLGDTLGGVYSSINGALGK
jgi:hypothetical protein